MCARAQSQSQFIMRKNVELYEKQTHKTFTYCANVSMALDRKTSIKAILHNLRLNYHHCTLKYNHFKNLTIAIFQPSCTLPKIITNLNKKSEVGCIQKKERKPMYVYIQ